MGNLALLSDDYARRAPVSYQRRGRRGIFSVATNRVVVLINGVRYPIRTVEDPSYVTGLAEEMDASLYGLMSQGTLSLNEALVLLSLEYMDSWKKSDRNLDNMRSQLAEYMEDAAAARQELAEAKREIERLKRKISGTGALKMTV